MNTISMKLQADELIRLALQEDISSEDVTTNSVMKEAVEGEDVYKRQLVTPPIHYIVLLHPISNKNTFSKKMTVRWSSFFVFFSNYFIDSFKIKFTSFLVEMCIRDSMWMEVGCYSLRYSYARFWERRRVYL